jgi:pyruvate formate lyase activating enzyme
MNFAGFQPATLSDYPGHVAAIVFTQGCNFRCPFCHNGNLLETETNSDRIPEAWIHEQLVKRRGQITGVVVTGGEPTLQGDLVPWLHAIKCLGYSIKLDTNGSKPQVLQKAIEEGVVDFIAMDAKAPFDKYAILAGVPVDTSTIRQSITIIAESGLPHEFRTTYATPLLNEADLDTIKKHIPDGSPLRIQPFQRENALDQQLRTPISVE